MAAADKKTTYSAAEVAVLEDTILKQKQEIEELKRKLEHMNDVLANAQRARFGQSSEQKGYVLGKDQLSLFNEAEEAQDHKAEEPTPGTAYEAFSGISFYCGIHHDREICRRAAFGKAGKNLGQRRDFP